MINKLDLRVQKTKSALYSALLNLMKNKTFEEKKVCDICKEALINRSTFYDHYNDKYELFLDFVNSLKISLLNALSNNNKIINTKDYYIDMIKLLLDYIDNEKNVYFSILISNRNSIVMDILLDVINDDVKKRINENNNLKDKVPSNVISTFYIGAVVSLGIEWIKNSQKYTKQDIINYLNILIPDDIDKL